MENNRKCALCGKPIYVGRKLGTRGFVCENCFSILPSCVKISPDGLTTAALKKLVESIYATYAIYANLKVPVSSCSYKKIKYLYKSKIVLFSSSLFHLDNLQGIRFQTAVNRKLPDGSGYVLDVFCKILLHDPDIFLQDKVGEEVVYSKDLPLNQPKPWESIMKAIVWQKKLDAMERGKEKRAYSRELTSKYHDALVLFMFSPNQRFTEEELKKRYRKLQKVFHPDNGDIDAEAAQKINESYGILKNYLRTKNEKEETG